MRLNLKPLACHTRAHCVACRTDPDWRERAVGVREFDCPHGIAADSLPDGPASSGIGDRYKAALSARIGGVPCGACTAEQQRMNGLTRDHAIAERDQIIEGTIKRAKNSERWRDRIKAKLGDAIAPGALRKIIGECFDEAVGRAAED